MRSKPPDPFGHYFSAEYLQRVSIIQVYAHQYVQFRKKHLYSRSDRNFCAGLDRCCGAIVVKDLFGSQLVHT